MNVPQIDLTRTWPDIEPEVLEAVTTDPGSLSDFPSWAKSSGNEIVKTEQGDGEIRFFIKRNA